MPRIVAVCRGLRQRSRDMFKRLMSLVLPGMALVCSFAAASQEAPDVQSPAKVVRVGSTNNFPPVNILSEDQRLTGFGVDLSDAVFARLGWKPERRHSEHWNEVTRWLREDRIDVIHDTGYTPERQQWLAYSDPVIEMDEVIHVRNDSAGIESFADLAGHRVACVRNHITHYYLKQYPGIRCHVVETPLEALGALVAGVVDAFVYPREIVEYYGHRKHLLRHLRVTGEPVRRLHWSMTVKLGNEALLVSINRALAELRENGQYAQIHGKWFNKPMLSGYSRTETNAILITAGLLALMAAAIAGLYIYSQRLQGLRRSLTATVSALEQTRNRLQESEVRFHDISVNMPGLVFQLRKRPDGYELLYLNGRLCREAGMHGSVSGKKMDDFLSHVHEDDRRAFVERLDKSSDNLAPLNISFRFLSEFRHWRWLRGISDPAIDADGSTVWHGVFYDVTELHMVEENLRQSEHELRGIVESLQDTYFRLNEAGQLVYLSPSVSVLTGHPYREMIGRSFAEFCREHPVFEDLQQHMRRNGGVVTNYQMELSHRDGGVRWGLVNAHFIIGREDIRGGLEGTIRDITDLKRAQDMIRTERDFSTTVLESVSSIVIVTDGDGRIIDSNRACKESLGYEDSELYQQAVWDYLPESQHKRLMRQLYKDQARFGSMMEARWCTKQGDLRDLLFNVVAQDDQAQSGRIYILTGSDITDRMEAERRLRKAYEEMEDRVTQRTAELNRLNQRLLAEVEVRKMAEAEARTSETRLRAILDNAMEGIVTTDEHGHVVSFNRAAEKVFGLSARRVAGKPLHCFLNVPQIPSMTSNDYVNWLRKSDRTGSHRKSDIFAVNPGGEEVPVEIGITRVVLDAGPVYIWVIRDISERKRIEKLQNDFVSMVSHELRTPLTSIRGALGLATSGTLGALPASVADLLGIASQNSVRLSRLIDDILDVEKYEFSNIHIDRKVQHLMPIVEHAVRDNEAYALEHQVSLETGLRIDDAEVNVSADRINQVITNLISNACKFSPAGSRVKVDVERRGDQVRVSVSDQGAGVPDHFRDRLFEKFSQADSSTTRAKGGTGLGLSISKALIERHDGHVGFLNRKEGGATFYFDLPECGEHAQVSAMFR